MHDLPVPPDRFFSTARSATGGPNGCAIDAPQLLVDLAGIDVHRMQARKDFVQCTVGVPFVEQIPYSSPRPKFFRQVAPRRSCSHDPQNTVDNHPPIRGRPPCLCRRRKNVRDTIPLFIRKSMSRHLLPLLVLRLRHQYALIFKTRKYEFSDKA